MGADNWGVCPNCKRLAEAEKVKQQELVGASYGKVTPEKYRELFEQAAEPLKLERTFREDYEIGVDEDGEFFASYRGGCGKCGFEFNFKEEKNVLKAAR